MTLLIFMAKNDLINDSLSNQTIQNNSRVLSNDSSFKSCKTGETWVCRAITRGEDSVDAPPQVCGCIPNECPSDNKYLVISDTMEIWPDNSRKGHFECSDVSIA